MAEYVDPIGAGLSGLSEGFVRGATLATILGQRRGSVRHQRELELQNALQIDDPGIQELRLKDLLDKGVVDEASAGPFIERAHAQNTERMKLGSALLLPNLTADTQEAMLEESRKTLLSKGYPIPSFFKEFEASVELSRKRETAQAKGESIGFLRLLGRANDPEAGDAVRKTAIGAITARLEKMGASESMIGMLQKLKPDEMHYMITSLSRQVLDEGLTINQALNEIRQLPDDQAAIAIGDLIKQGKTISAGAGYGTPAATEAPGAGAPAAGDQPPGQPTPPAPAAPAAPQVPATRRMMDVNREVSQLKTDLRALETEGGNPAEVLAIRKELAKRTEDLRTLEEEHDATIASTASGPAKTYIDRLSGVGKQIDAKQDQIQAIEDKGLDKTPGGQKRIEALNKQIDEHNKQLDKMADTGPITKDEHLVRALQDAGIPITDKRQVAAAMGNKESAARYLEQADAIKKISDSKKAKLQEGEKVHSAKVEDARGGHLQLYKMDEKGKVTNLAKIPLGRDPIGQTMTLLRARVAGMNTGIKEMDALNPKKAEDLLMRLNRADPVKAMLSQMLEGGGAPKVDDILKQR